jgi:cytochrome c
MWKVDGKPDVHNTACMKGCDVADKPSSRLPDSARDAHGDLAAQMRIVGPVRGVNTTAPALTGTVQQNAAKVREYARSTIEPKTSGESTAAGSGSADSAKAQQLVQANGCVSCHARDKKVLGPAFIDISKKYKGNPDIIKTLAAKLKSGGSGVWGPVPMPANPNVSDADAKTMLEWILAGAPN